MRKLSTPFGRTGLAIVVSLGVAAVASGVQGTERTNTVVVSRERQAYGQNCAACHGSNLGGGQFGPSLKDGAFRAKWSDDDRLLDYISTAMPPANPGGLSKEVYQQLVALIRAEGEQGIASVGHKSPRSLSVAHASAISESVPVPAKADPENKSAGAEVAADGPPVDNHDALYQAEIARRSSILQAIGNVSEAQLRGAASGSDWTSIRRTDDGQAFSPLTEINRRNVRVLRPVYALALPTGTNEIAPLVIGGVMFINSNGTVMAIEAQTGEILWRFDRPVPSGQVGAPISQPRGLAIFEDKLFVPTIDRHVIALDIRSGKVLWDHLVEASGQIGFTGSPLVVHGKVIMGTTGCVDTKVKCFLAALDARTGAEAWRFYTIPQPDELNGDSWNGAAYDRRGGGSIWGPTTYDPDSNLIYFGTGQTYNITTLMTTSSVPNPTNAGLYTDSTLALNPDTGKLVWFYQHMARDLWDLDWSFERIIATIAVEGKPRKVVMTMGKLGILDVLDAASGSYIFSVDLGVQNLVTSIDPKTGAKTTDPKLDPQANQWKFICPLSNGVRSWPGASYDPQRHLLFVAASDSCMDFGYVPGEGFDLRFRARTRANGDGKYGFLAAIDLDTRKVKWSMRRRASMSSATLSTRGGIVLAGSNDTQFGASDSDTGQELWKIRLDGNASATPVTFVAQGVQYIAVTTGGGNPNDWSRQYLTPEINRPPSRTTLWVFALPKIANKMR